MLQTFTVEPRTFVLLERLQSLEIMADTRLVGGTALALQLGHRSSVDLDMFGSIDVDQIEEVLNEQNFETLSVVNNSKNIKQYVINDIKVDLVNYKYGWIEPVIECGGVRLAGLRDIAAMKISAITGRGSKKDFIDLYFLLNTFTLKQIVEFYTLKYPHSSLMMVYKNLSYFMDADAQAMPLMFVEVSWQTIKERLQKEIENL